MFDSVTLSAIPHLPFALAGYTAGIFANYVAMRRFWPTAHTVSIAINARYHADCADVEPSLLSPSQAGPWAAADIRAGYKRPCLYSDLSEMPQVQASLHAWLGLNWRSRVFLWLAWYRNFPGLVPGYDAVQWSQNCFGLNLDCSTVTLAFLTVATPPYVAPRPDPFFIFPVTRFASRYGVLNERLVAEQTDGALQHPVKYAALLRRLEPEDAWLASRLSYLAHHVWGTPTHPNWRPFHAGSRFQILEDLAHGHRIS